MEPFDRSGDPSHARSSPAVTIVVPAYNESHRLGESMPGMLELASSQRELIFVDDGSTDDTLARLRVTVGARPGIQVLRLRQNQGKGAALRAGIQRATGRTVMFMDADLATDVEQTDALLGALAHSEIAIGSRAVAGAVIESATRRRSQMGHVFNRLVRSSTGLRFRDTQCGFKAFRTDVARLLFHLNQIDGFAFDAVMLASAQRMNLTIREVPVRWHEVEGTHVRPFRDPLRMAFDVVVSRRTRVRSVLALSVRSPGPEVPAIGTTLSRVVGCVNPVVASSDHHVAFLPFATESEARAHRRRVLAAFDAPVTVEVVELAPSSAVHLVARRSALVDQWPPRPNDRMPTERAIDVDLREAAVEREVDPAR